jgi:hypothetical protein
MMVAAALYDFIANALLLFHHFNDEFSCEKSPPLSPGHERPPSPTLADFIVAPYGSATPSIYDVEQTKPRSYNNIYFDYLPENPRQDEQDREVERYISHSRFEEQSPNISVPAWMMVYPNLDQLRDETVQLFRQGYLMPQDYTDRVNQIRVAKRVKRVDDVPHIDFSTSTIPLYDFAVPFTLMCHLNSFCNSLARDGRDKPREVRLFVSSTFVDMQHEREALVKKVFPEIKAFCEARGISFAPVRASPLSVYYTDRPPLIKGCA